MKKYYIHVPTWIYAMTCYGSNEADARRRFRLQHGFGKLPNGTKVWEDKE